MGKLVTLDNLEKKPGIMFGRPIARQPMWENQIKFQQAFLMLANEGYGVYIEDLDSLNWWLKHHSSCRNNIVAEFLNRKNCDYLVWIDDDMTFIDLAADIKRAISLNKDMVMGITSCKPTPHFPNIGKFAKIGDSGTIIDSIGYHIYEFPTDKPFEVDYGSMGFCVMKRKVLEKVPPPWFYFPPNPLTNNVWGEDVTFFFNAKMCGFELWCDPTIHCGHLGYTAWHHEKQGDHYLDYKESLIKQYKDNDIDYTHRLVPEVQERFKKGEGPGDWWYATTKTV